MDFAKRILTATWPDWEIVGDAEIGKGSYGKVYKIKREYIGGREQFAALKVIRFSDTADREHINEMVEEIELMTELKGNTNIVSYEDHKVIEDKDDLGCTILLRMELLTPFSEYIKAKELDNQEIVRLGIDICKALELLQKKKIIHRDIKPQNIFVSEDGNFKLGDFGSARSIDMTQDVMTIAGSWPYMAPEIVKFEPYGKNVDIYSLGTVLYELLNNGCKPHYPSPKPTAKEAEAALQKKLSGEKLSPPCNSDNVLSGIVMKACEFDSKKRFPSATEMKKELERWIISKEPNECLTPKIKEKRNIAFSKISHQKNKTSLKIFVCIFFVVAIVSCGVCIYVFLQNNGQSESNSNQSVLQSETTSSVIEKEKLLKKIQAEANTTFVAHYQYDDFDKDGDKEIFAVVGEEAIHTQVGSLWFADKEKVMQINEYAVADSVVLDIGSRKCFLPYQAVNGEPIVEIWYLNNSVPFSDYYSGKIGQLELLENNIITAHNYYCWDKYTYYNTDSNGETQLSLEGKTSKKYYFFDDGKNLQEYTGYYIHRYELCEYDGAKELLDEIERDGWTVTEYLIRNCNIININYEKRNDDGTQTFENATLKIVGNKVELVIINEDTSLPDYLRSSYGGIYMPSATDAIVAEAVIRQ